MLARVCAVVPNVENSVKAEKLLNLTGRDSAVE
jgi:hypothetical protein